MVLGDVIVSVVLVEITAAAYAAILDIEPRDKPRKRRAAGGLKAMLRRNMGDTRRSGSPDVLYIGHRPPE
jgi:hypothetical protein